MADGREKQSKGHRLIRRAGAALLSLLLMGAAYLAAVLLQSPQETKAAQKQA